jgi:hypothetical protein
MEGVFREGGCVSITYASFKAEVAVVRLGHIKPRRMAKTNVYL